MDLPAVLRERYGIDHTYADAGGAATPDLSHVATMLRLCRAVRDARADTGGPGPAAADRHLLAPGA